MLNLECKPKMALKTFIFSKTRGKCWTTLQKNWRQHTQQQFGGMLEALRDFLKKHFQITTNHAGISTETDKNVLIQTRKYLVLPGKPSLNMQTWCFTGPKNSTKFHWKITSMPEYCI